MENNKKLQCCNLSLYRERTYKKMENPNTKQMQKMKHLWTSLGKRMPFIPLFYVTTLSLSPLPSLPTLQLHAPFSVLLKWLKLLDAVP